MPSKTTRKIAMPSLCRRRSKTKIIVISVFCFLLLALALGTWAYFSKSTRAEGNRVGMASLDLEVTEEDGSQLAPIDLSGVYPGWSYELCGKVKNRGSADLLFRLRIDAGNDDFNYLAKAMSYDLRIENSNGQVVYSKSGYADDFSSDNALMNVLIAPNVSYTYKLGLAIPGDMDDHTTPANEDDNIYQGKNAEFDLLIDSTQANNASWNGF